MGEPEAKRLRSERTQEDDLIEEDDFAVDYDYYDEDDPEIGQTGDDAAADMTVSNFAPIKMDAFSYHILSLEDIYLKIQSMVREVHEIIQDVPASTLRTMLNHVNWEKDGLINRYFEDEEKFLAEAKAQRSGDPGIFSTEPEVEHGLCEICLEELSEETSYSISCGHNHCRSCWTQYLTHNIMEEGMGQTITCPSCKIIVEDVDVQSLVQDPLVIAKYKMLICFNFVESNRRMRWCPKAGCDHAASADIATWGRVDCSCGQSFCFQCSHEWHEPVQCDLLKIWLVKLSKDTGNSDWMMKHTKDCPTCSAMIEKNGGCNRMRCRKCNADFCWNCGKLWTSHEGNAYGCNRYIAPQNNTESTMRANLKRFAHFFTRYNNHLQSLKLEANLEDMLEGIARDYQADHGMTWNEARFLKEAFEVLTKCRNTLRYTYAFAYYLQPTHMSEIFNNNQSHLERETEALSMFLERDIMSSRFTPAENRTRISDKYNYCEQRRLVLIQHVYDGYKDGTWIFTPNLDSA